MSSVADACEICSLKFGDLKSIIKCTICANYFHKSCEGITDNRGVRKSSWKCTQCSRSNPDVSILPEVVSIPGPSRKRSRNANSDTVEIDRVVLDNMVKLLTKLSNDSQEMKTALLRLSKQNQVLIGEITVLKDKLSDEEKIMKTFSYASATKGEINKNNKHQGFNFNVKALNNSPGLSNNFNDEMTSASLSTFPKAMDQSNGLDHKSGFSLNQVKKAVTSALLTTISPNNTVDNNKFITVQNKKKKKSPTVMFGSKTIATPENGSSVLQGVERFRWVYVGRCKPSTTPELLVEYVKQHIGIHSVKCYELFKNETFSSFKVGVSESLLQQILDVGNWPQHVAIREFVNLPKKKKSPIDPATQGISDKNAVGFRMETAQIESNASCNLTLETSKKEDSQMQK